MALQESQSALIPKRDHRRSKDDCARRSLRLAAFLLLAVVPVFACDLPISGWLKGGPLPSTLNELLEISEVFAHGLGVGLILLTVAVLDPRGRRFLVRLAVMSLGAGIMANVIKLLIARARPRAFDWEGTVLDTFSGFLPFSSGGSNVQGFPSAHTATAAGLAVALAWLYPQGRWWFALLAVLSACQRLEAMAHFPSDVVCGAIVGCLWAGCCLRNGRLGQVFDRVEDHLDRSAEDCQKDTQPGEQRSRAA